MNKNILKYILCGAVAIGVASCGENSWNDRYLDGFEGGVDYENPETAAYTLTEDDYETISKQMLTLATNRTDTTAARAIASNYYFDKTSAFPASYAVAYFLGTASSPFYYFSNGSSLDVTYTEVSSQPEEMSAIAGATTYTVSKADYQGVWDSETDYISSFAPEHTAEASIPNILKTAITDAKAGDYKIVSYNTATENPVFSSADEGTPEITSAIKNLEVGDNLKATAVVTAQCSRGLILTDNGGSILYYNTAVNLADYPIGSIVKVSGEVSAYNRGLQLSNAASITVVGSEEYTYPAPTNYTAAMVDEACAGSGNMLATYVTISGTMSISGSYYNVIIDGASAQGSVYYVSDEVKAKLENGVAYTLYGYYVAVNGSTTKYFNIVVTDAVKAISKGDLSDAIKDLSVGDNLSATAVVTAQCVRGLILTDNAGSILYYNTAIDLSKYPIGTIVKVNGEVSAYNRGLQLSDKATLEVTGQGAYQYPAPTNYTAAMIDEACAGSGNMLATYVTIDGKMSISGSYYNVIIDGATAQGSLYYATDEVKAKLQNGSSYKLYGYYMAVNGSTTKYFNMVVTDVLAANAPATSSYAAAPVASRTVSFSPSTTSEYAVYYYNGSAWSVADNVTVLNPADYDAMGFNNNSLTDAEIYLPMFMRVKFPYALPGAQRFVAYNVKDTGCTVSVLVNNGTSWEVNNNNLEVKRGLFSKESNSWKFVKELGKAVYNLFTDDQIELNRTYIIVGGSVCATPVPASNSYGYLQATKVTDTNGQIVMASDANGFTFATTCVYEDKTYTTPEGTFVIRDTNGRYLYLQGTYNSFNVRANNPYIETDGTIGTSYLFSATKNADGTWNIVNSNEKIFFYSSGYNNFAAYASGGASDVLPYLYLLDE